MRLRAPFTDKAFTLIEVAIALGIVGLLVLAAVPVYTNLYASSKLDDVTTETVSALRTARERSSARVGNMTHGILFAQNAYTHYQIPAGALVRDPALDEEHVFEDISFASNLSDNDITFSRGTGVPDIVSDITITITHSTGSTRTITVTPAGLIDVQ